MQLTGKVAESAIEIKLIHVPVVCIKVAKGQVAKFGL